MKVFSINGWSGSGKTTLITRLIERFKGMGRRVAAVKRVPDKFYLEPESTDSFAFLESGADEVCLAANRRVMFMEPIAEGDDIALMLMNRYAGAGYDLLLLEGLRREDIPMLEVFDAGSNPSLKFPIHSLCAIISDRPVSAGIPIFERDDIDGIVKFMEAYHG